MRFFSCYVAFLLSTCRAFQSAPSRHRVSALLATLGDNDLSAILTDRFPTSVEDQVRQASEALRRANNDGYHRHSIRLLLPLIGATDLDDWPGGTRQMAEAANPLVQGVMKNLGALRFSVSILDESDGVGAIMAQAEDPKSDSCAVLLPSGDTVDTLQSLEEQVGPKRDLLLVTRSGNGNQILDSSGVVIKSAI